MTRVALALLLAGSAACSTRNGGPDREAKALELRHGKLGPDWKKTAIAGLRAAWYHAGYGATIGVAAQCKDVEDVGLEALTQQELIGIEDREVLEQGKVEVDGREATDWVVKGSLDGVEIRLELVVMRRGDCVLDLNLVCPPGSFEKARPDFRAFVAGFSLE